MPTPFGLSWCLEKDSVHRFTAAYYMRVPWHMQSIEGINLRQKEKTRPAFYLCNSTPQTAKSDMVLCIRFVGTGFQHLSFICEHSRYAMKARLLWYCGYRSSRRACSCDVRQREPRCFCFSLWGSSVITHSSVFPQSCSGAAPIDLTV